MPDFSVRSDSVNVEQIMEQIRARITEKRGVDYTEQQIRELAAVKLEKFLDPRGVRSDLLDQFRKAQPAYQPPELPNFAFEDATLFESHRAPIRWIRKLLMPLLKLLFNPNPLIQALNIQSRLNTINAEREARNEAARRQMDQLYYELVHNLVVETTRTGIEVKNLKMRVESMSSRLEFTERRARALEGAVVYKEADEPQPAQRPTPPPQQPQSRPPYQQRPPQSNSYQQQQRSSPPPPPQQAPSPPPPAAPIAAAVPSGDAQTSSPQQPGQAAQGAPGEGPGQRSRRRRRRRGRRGGGSASAVMGAPGTTPPGTTPAEQSSGDATDSMDAMDGPDDDGPDDAEEGQAPAAARVETLAVTPSHEAPSHEVPPPVAAPSHEAAQPEATHAAPADAAPHAAAPPAAEPAAPAADTPSTDHAGHDPQ